ncbi:MAG: TetR/AcrR family transcriptional regulator [Aeromicrobium sp.]|uniref:TetR/AcrR family transcriptional regulator n=1 Tax=Aeromicrobium sp. TaxID=1871063 RepID=UPI003C6B8A18
MASTRNKDRILDAARETILSSGWRRATVTDVARRADVSRMTVYRTYPDMQSILADLMTREWVGEIDRVLSQIDDRGNDSADVIARRFGAAVAALRHHELFRRIVRDDPEQLLPYLIDRRGRSQDVLVSVLAEQIATAQATGGIRADRPELLARTLILIAHGFAISVETMTDDELTVDEFDAQLTDLIRRYLTP